MTSEARKPMVIPFMVPIKTISEINRSRHEHWGSVRRRVDKQKKATAGHAMEAGVRVGRIPVTVTMVRVGTRELDDDNLRSALKAPRDSLANVLGIKDNDPRVQWLYDQTKCKRGQECVRVEIRYGS